MSRHSNNADNKSQSVQDWITSDRLYEEYLFFYMLICLFWFFVGLFSIGIRFPSLTDEQNLLLNALWWLLLCVALSVPKFWYTLIKGKNAYLFRATAPIYEQLNSIDDAIQRQEKLKELDQNGKLPPNRCETLALAFIFALLMFDMLYIRCWITGSTPQTLTLVWQPDWVTACIDWVRSHLNMPPLNEDRDWFIVSFTTEAELKEIFGNEQNFLDSASSNVALFHHFIRVVMFIPILAALLTVLWKPLNWLGIGKIDPRHIHSPLSFLRSCAWSIVFGFFVLIGTWFYTSLTTLFTLGLINKSGWFEEIYMNFFYVFIVFGIRFFYGWLVFWHNVSKQRNGRLSKSNIYK